MNKEIEYIFTSSREDIDKMLKERIDALHSQGCTFAHIDPEQDKKMQYPYDVKRQLLAIDRMHELGLTRELKEFELFNENYFV